MTVRDYLLLSWLAYLDLPEYYRNILSRGGTVPVPAFADAVLRMDAAGALTCVRLYDAARDAAREARNLDAELTGYVNDNENSGFAAYVIRAGDETVVAMRGSESRSSCAGSSVDWVDNVCEPFVGSVQLNAIREIIAPFSQGKVAFTGHSKGAHNALAALSVSKNPQARAIAFNGQGFGADALTGAQKEILRRRAVNYVVASDVIGALLEHPEKRVYVRQVPGTNAHYPEAFSFDDKGNPIPAKRAVRSRVAEAVTRLTERLLPENLKGGISNVCRALLPGGGS